MTITAQLKNIKDFEAVGFTHEQAEVLAEVQETTAIAHDESLKEYLDHRFEALDHRFEALDHRFEALDHRFEAIETKIEVSEQRLKTEIAKSSSDLLIKIFGIIVGSISVAVAVLKLFP